jgi:hypothetical protein
MEALALFLRMAIIYEFFDEKLSGTGVYDERGTSAEWIMTISEGD